MMKKFLLAAAFAAMFIPLLQASPLGALQNARIKAQQAISATNLATIYSAAIDYQEKNQKLPALTVLDVPVKVLFKPYHALGGQQPQVPDKIAEVTSGYAWFGEALGKLTPQAVTGKVPLAFEKPGQRPDKKIQVLFANGKIEQLDIDAENCAGVIEKLKPEKADETIWNKLTEAAKKIDEAK